MKLSRAKIRQTYFSRAPYKFNYYFNIPEEFENIKRGIVFIPTTTDNRINEIFNYLQDTEMNLPNKLISFCGNDYPVSYINDFIKCLKSKLIQVKLYLDRFELDQTSLGYDFIKGRTNYYEYRMRYDHFKTFIESKHFQNKVTEYINLH